MSLEQKLNVYTIKLNPESRKTELTNRWLFRNIINEVGNAPIDDAYLFMKVFACFVKKLDTQEMFSDEASHKCITINQNNIEQSDVNTNVFPHPEQCIIEGKLEGGSFGRRRTKTFTANKTQKTEVKEKDAITDNIYFMLYCPLQSDKSVLFIHSYSDNSVDSVFRAFIRKFLKFDGIFKDPHVKRFIPKSIISDFKSDSTIANLTYTTEVPGESLLDKTYQTKGRNYKVSIKITPIGKEFTIDEFDRALEPIGKTMFTQHLSLKQFSQKKGIMRDRSTNKTSPFEIEKYNVKPVILMSKYIDIKNDESDFDRIKEYCLTLLQEIKSEIYPQYAVQSR
jgi:hypothetical protein